MSLNYSLILLVLLVLIVLLIVFLRRNAKDKKSLGEQLNASELQPDKHDDDETAKG